MQLPLFYIFDFKKIVSVWLKMEPDQEQKRKEYLFIKRSKAAERGWDKRKNAPVDKLGKVA